jgi:hypothetical protein
MCCRFVRIVCARTLREKYRLEGIAKLDPSRQCFLCSNSTHVPIYFFGRNAVTTASFVVR